MNLNYSILWFDDDQEFFESLDMAPVLDEIQSWGFVPQIEAVHSSEEFNAHEPFDKFDLIVVDFKLGDELGDTFIKKIRDNEVFTEVILYSFSESSDLWNAIHQRQLEGVFITHKSGISQKLIRVARQSVRKVLDLENMRGIVMSEVGDLDALLESIFIGAMKGIDPEHQQKVFDRFHEKADEQAQQQNAAIHAFKENPSIEGLLNLCDSDKRWQNFNRVKKLHTVLNAQKISTDYQAAILWPRNCLAHGMPERKDDGSLLFRHKDKEFIFNDAIGQAIRHKILEYKLAFSQIAEILNVP
jgi:hypothetical protein